MHSPPSSSEIFFSSPPRNTGNGPEDEVEFLFGTARRIKTLDENLHTFFANNKAEFLDVFSRQIQILKSRSQAFEDAHVTVYDKVLLLLTHNGNDLESPAAIHWYCNEFLGVNNASDPNSRHQLLKQAVIVPTRLTQALKPTPSRKNFEAVPRASGAGEAFRSMEQSDIKNDPVFARLWTVYNKSYNDYLAVADQGDTESLEAARFLRDTAENGIHYLRDKYPGEPTLTELTNTYDTARMAVLKLNGGKKRKFDGGNPAANRPPARSSHATAHAAAHGQKTLEQRRRRGPERDYHAREKRRGRGHSNIPYGYTRPVDSYYPA